MTLPNNSLEKQASWLLQAKIEVAKKQTALAQSRRLTERGLVLRGNNLHVQNIDATEVLLVGAAGTGKTLAILHKLNRLMWDFPNARALIVRKVRADLAQSTLVTFERDVLGEENALCAGIQRENRQTYRYQNGSLIVVGGMDRAGKILSAEYDFIYPAEATQFDLRDWETFVMRLRSGKMPFQQVLADTNPDRPDHWLKQRCDAGKTRLLNTFHQDNPRYWQDGQWTEQGRNYVLGKLETLTGVWRERYLKGLWVLAEGAIYEEWREDIHLIDADKLPEFITRYRVIDFGYNNPSVCIFCGIDADNRIYVYREIYHTRTLAEDLAKEILTLSAGEKYEATIADHDAEDRATLERHGVDTIAADKAVSSGIQLVQSRLRVQPDGKPRLFVVRGCRVKQDFSLKEAGKPTCLQEEFGGYVWANKQTREEPVKANDHALDALRYLVAYVDTGNAQVTYGTIKDVFDF